MDASRDKAEKKKRKVKAKLETTSKKEDVANAVKSIDDLFEGVKKTKKEEAATTSSAAAAKSTARKGDQKTKVKASKSRPSKDDFEEDDGGMEYYDDDEEAAPNDEDSSRTYGIIQSRYRPSQIVNPEAPLERIDPASGLPVYKAHILKVGEGGGTPLCPFDCACCF